MEGEADVLQHLRPIAVAQPDALEADDGVRAIRGSPHRFLTFAGWQVYMGRRLPSSGPVVLVLITRKSYKYQSFLQDKRNE